MTNEDLNPDVYEKMYLLNIESQNTILISNIKTFCTRITNKIATLKELSSVLDLLDMYDVYFFSYAPIAQRLDALGKTQLSKRLYEISYDVQETIKIFRQLQDANNNIRQDTILMKKGVDKL